MRPCLSRELPVVYGSSGEEFFSVEATSKLNVLQYTNSNHTHASSPI